MSQETNDINIDNVTENLCQICMDNEKDIRFDCGHCVCCEDCFIQLSEKLCPLCRSPIERYYKNLNKRDSFINPENGRLEWGKMMKMKKKQHFPRIYRACISTFGITRGTLVFCVICISIGVYFTYQLVSIFFPIIYIILGSIYLHVIVFVYGLVGIIYRFTGHYIRNTQSVSLTIKLFYFVTMITNIILFLILIIKLLQGNNNFTSIEIVILYNDMLTTFTTFGVVLLAIFTIIIISCTNPSIVIDRQSDEDTSQNISDISEQNHSLNYQESNSPIHALPV